MRLPTRLCVCACLSKTVICITMYKEKKSIMTSFFVPALLFFMLALLLSIFFCFFVLFHRCCSHVQVFGKTIVHDFLISIAILNVLIFFARENSSCFGRCLAYKNHIKSNNYFSTGFIHLNVDLLM